MNASEKTSIYVGVSYNKQNKTWVVQRRNNENKKFYNGIYKNEITAAHASDTLARELIAKGKKGHKLNFPDNIEIQPETVTKSIKPNKRTISRHI